MILTVAMSLYPNGFKTTIGCANNAVFDEDKKEPKCTFLETAVMDLETLLRVDKNTSVDDAVESATNDFLDDYVINDSLTALIPKTINRKPIPVAAVQNKNEAIFSLTDSSKFQVITMFLSKKINYHFFF